MAKIAIINPRFEISFWGMEYSLPFLGKRANFPIASLPLLAALTPHEHDVKLIDENVEPIDFNELLKVDIVGITGMSCQRFRMREILTECKARDLFVVAGGPLITVQEGYLECLVDVIFIGEAEQSWPRFLKDWQLGKHQTRYEQTEKTDMSTVPIPRLDLLKMKHYSFGSMQISRGCPYQCEFCDIIVTFGRQPRLKTSVQVIAELEALKKQKMELVFVVDDNFIGNKKAIKKILPNIIDWQRKRGYPLSFFTEATLDLSEDEQLMKLMGEAGFLSVFIGIETPNEEALKETRKNQNVKPQAGTLLERIHHIQKFGFDVWSGMIVGFDSDNQGIFNAQRGFLEKSGIIHAMVGMLHAIPKTPLHQRLGREARLDHSDNLEYGTNVIPLQMTREELRDGYIGLMKDIYETEAYFDRMDALFIDQRFKYAMNLQPYWRKHPWPLLKRLVTDFAFFLGVTWRLMRRVPEIHLRQAYQQRIRRLFAKRPFDPDILLTYSIYTAMHYHYYKLAQGSTSLGRTGVVTSW